VLEIVEKGKTNTWQSLFLNNHVWVTHVFLGFMSFPSLASIIKNF
jgi:hypothetical protein